MPQSYALSAIATVQAQGRTDRRFSMFRFRRYDADARTRCLADCGWQRIAQLGYGPAGQRAALILCPRCDEESRSAAADSSSSLPIDRGSQP